VYTAIDKARHCSLHGPCKLQSVIDCLTSKQLRVLVTRDPWSVCLSTSHVTAVTNKRNTQRGAYQPPWWTFTIMWFARGRPLENNGPYENCKFWVIPSRLPWMRSAPKVNYFQESIYYKFGKYPQISFADILLRKKWLHADRQTHRHNWVNDQPPLDGWHLIVIADKFGGAL